MNVRYLILDRATIYTAAFRDLLKRAEIKVVRLPPRSPNLNAYAERFVRTIKESCLDRMIFFGERSLRNAILEFLEHDHHERNHQGPENRLIDPQDEVGSLEGSVACRERLGGILRYYYQDTASSGTAMVGAEQQQTRYALFEILSAEAARPFL